LPPPSGSTHAIIEGLTLFIVKRAMKCALQNGTQERGARVSGSCPRGL